MGRVYGCMKGAAAPSYRYAQMAMSVPLIRHASPRLRLFAVAIVLRLVPSCAVYAKGPEPPRRIPLAQLGYQAPSPNALPGSGALSTVHFLDERHLLVTFNVRRLMKRMVDCPPEDVDRTVEAVLIELPAGRTEAKVLARANWRIHDGGQYLWDIGGGRLLLRVRDTLTTVAPLENLPRGEAFAEQPFLKSKRKVAAVILSPERDLVTVETVEYPARKENGEAVLEKQSKLTQINFYRVMQSTAAEGRVVAQAAGAAAAKGLVRIPLNAAGYLEIMQESPNRWLFDFTSYGGKHLELSPFDTTCRPIATFVSQAEFVALGCRGSSDRLSIGGFNMRGEQMWQQDFTDTHAFPNYVFAPAVGRFALSRNIVATTAGITVDFAPQSFTTQEIRVYQSYNGKQLLRTEASPVQRTGQNYDLSPDGLNFAVLHNDAIEVYRLPELSKSDVAGVKASRALVPDEAHGTVNLAARKKRLAEEEKDATAEAAEPVTAPSKLNPSPVALQQDKATEAPVAVTLETGDGATDKTPRNAPSLYTLPGEKATQKPQDQ